MLSGCVSNDHQVESESVNRVHLAAEGVSCHACLEENKVCRCQQSCTREEYFKGTVDGIDIQRHQQSNSSFAHAVINMIGMLIGKLSVSFLLLSLFLSFFSVDQFLFHTVLQVWDSCRLHTLWKMEAGLLHSS